MAAVGRAPRGPVSDTEWRDLEACLDCGAGACNTMGTASTMALMAEALGLMIPGSSTIPSGDPAALAAAHQAGRCAVAAVSSGLSPSAVLSPAAFGNAVRVLHAAAGSTNAVIHLPAIAGRVGVPLPLDDFGRLGAGVPVLADVQPSGTGLMQDFHAAGGLPALLAELAPLLDPSPVTVTGKSLGEIIAAAPPPKQGGAIRRRDDPLRTGGAFAIVHGSLAPHGAVIKVSAATPELLRHRGRAVVFHGYADMRHRVDDPDLPVTPTVCWSWPAAARSASRACRSGA